MSFSEHGPATAAGPRRSHIASLDGLRAVSILLVVFSHAGVSHRIPGGFGVTVFFFLSGYLITTLLVREYARFGTINIRNFYLRRVIRLTPPLLLTLAGAVLLVLAGWVGGRLDPMTLFSQVFFFFNYYSLGPASRSIDGLSILWSLSVEEHFYFLWPALFLMLSRGRIGLGHLAGLIGLVLLWRSVRFFLFGTPEWAIYISTDTRIDSLLFGCLLALLQAGHLAKRQVSPVRMYALLGLSLGLLLVTFVIRDPAFRSTLRYTIQGLALMPIFHFAVTRPELWAFQPLNWAPVRQIGVWSYTMYLCHFVIIASLQQTGLAPDNALLLAGVVLFLSCLWSALVYRFAERPFHGLRRRLSGPAPGLQSTT